MTDHACHDVEWMRGSCECRTKQAGMRVQPRLRLHYQRKRVFGTVWPVIVGYNRIGESSNAVSVLRSAEAYPIVAGKRKGENLTAELFLES
jgi:hypothetical protein